MIINDLKNPSTNFEALRLNKPVRQLKNPNLVTQFTDEFIKAMAESSEKKEVSTVLIDLLCRLKRINFPTNDGTKINSWLIKSLLPTNHYCLFLHGGTSTVGNYQNLYRELSNKNINVLALEFPGYGDNKNLESSYKLICESAESAYKYLTEAQKIPENEITILGYCFGGQIASKLASKHNPKALLLASPVTRLSEINPDYINSKNIPERFPQKIQKYITNSKIFKFFTRNEFRLDKNVDCPTYVFSSHEDVVTHKKWMDSFINKIKKDNITYINGYEKGHKLTDSKIELISHLLGKDIFNSEVHFRF